MSSAFSLYKYKTKTKTLWYARFRHPVTGKIYLTRSTGIPCTGKGQRKIEAHKAAEKILEKLEEDRTPFFVSYLQKFWTHDSQYAKMKRIVEKNPLSNNYMKMNALGVEQYILPFKPFKYLKLADLKPGIIDDWKLWVLEKGAGTR